MDNKKRFEILRGYYTKDGKYYPQGMPVGNLDDLLHKLEFNNLGDFSFWYSSLSKEEIKNEKDAWKCTGNCCNSILKQLLRLSKK